MTISNDTKNVTSAAFKKAITELVCATGAVYDFSKVNLHSRNLNRFLKISPNARVQAVINKDNNISIRFEYREDSDKPCSINDKSSVSIIVMSRYKNVEDKVPSSFDIKCN